MSVIKNGVYESKAAHYVALACHRASLNTDLCLGIFSPVACQSVHGSKKYTCTHKHRYWPIQRVYYNISSFIWNFQTVCN